jgi:cystathionine beta-lyase/cystathionine gamma-synthase
MSGAQKKRTESSLAHPAEELECSTPPLSPAIYLSSVWRVRDLEHIDALYSGQEPGYIYARDANVNADQLALKLALLERGEAGLVCSSGMAAVSSALMAFVEKGDHILLSHGLYGRTTRLVEHEFSRYGVQHTCFDPTRPDKLRELFLPNTKIVLVETLSNPLLRVADVPVLARLAHEHSAMLVVDHTFAPLLSFPIEQGADLVVHSLTKLIGGHSDVLLGAVVGASKRIDRCKALAVTFGMTASGFESWLVLRGMATLALRSQRASATALELSTRLLKNPKVKKVHYPGLSEHPDHALACKLFEGGFGAMFTIDVGGRRQADQLIRGLNSIPFAPSLGDSSTTLSHPSTTSHRGQSAEKLALQNVTPGLVRFSTGLEHPEDLWADLERALGTID